MDLDDASVGLGVGGGVMEEEEEVRAYFFSTSVDLRSLVEQNKQNYILTPLSRMTNYAVLLFGDLKADPKALACSLGGSDCCFMVVFQYGSIVLFNVHDNEIDGYLKIVEKHASGLLSEMRKDDGKTLRHRVGLFSVHAAYLVFLQLILPLE